MKRERRKVSAAEVICHKFIMGGNTSSSVNAESNTTVEKDEDVAVVLVPEIDKLFDRDPYLKLHEDEIRRRYIFRFILFLRSIPILFYFQIWCF